MWRPGGWLPELGLLEVGSAEEGLLEVGLRELGLLKVGIQEVGPREVGPFAFLAIRLHPPLVCVENFRELIFGKLSKLSSLRFLTLSPLGLRGFPILCLVCHGEPLRLPSTGISTSPEAMRRFRLVVLHRLEPL